MNIFKENQPDFLPISERLRLRRFNGVISQALEWYQDEKMLRLVDGSGRKPYSEENLSRMYAALNDLGELYYIEYKKDNLFRRLAMSHWRSVICRLSLVTPGYGEKALVFKSFRL